MSIIVTLPGERIAIDRSVPAFRLWCLFSGWPRTGPVGRGGGDATVAAPAGDTAGFGATVSRRWFIPIRQAWRGGCGAAAGRYSGIVQGDGDRDYTRLADPARAGGAVILVVGGRPG